MSETPARLGDATVTDTLYDYDTDSAQCAWCFSPVGETGCDWDHQAEEEAARVAEAQLLDPSKPSPVLNLLECAEGALTAQAVATATHLLVETVESELIRLARKGLVFEQAPGHWLDLLRYVPAAATITQS